MTLGLQILLMYYILCRQNDFKILMVKVVPNDKFKFGAKRVKAAPELGLHYYLRRLESSKWAKEHFRSLLTLL